MRRKIVAIGGGRIMVPAGKLPQTLSIDREIVRLSGRPRPRLLFIPTANLDDSGYCDRIEQHFGVRLGCKVDQLLLYRDEPNRVEISRKILAADIIYVGGGNTLRMMNLWKKLGIPNLLDRARKNGCVLSGLSAGCICWFRQGNSDSRKFADASNNTLIKVSGLNYADLLVCPHYDVEKHRQSALKKMMQKTAGVALALENGAAIEIIDKRFRIITSMKNKNAWKVYYQKGKYHKEKLPENEGFMPLNKLLSRN
ncbi:MAG: peptidase E [Gammaproteobacteria bacterium]|nr:peptidase E [Gammaproteobacteria bacterium]